MEPISSSQSHQQLLDLKKETQVGEVGRPCSSSASILERQEAEGADGVLASPSMVLTSPDLGKV